MKRAMLLFCAAAISFSAFAQKDPEEPKSKKGKSGKKENNGGQGISGKAKNKIHNEKVSKSKKSGKGASSRDTLYCSGKPYAIAKEESHNLMGQTTVYSFRAFKQSNEAFRTTLESVSSGANAVYYWVWTMGDIRFETEQKENPVDMVCYHYLFTDSLLNKKNFNTMKQTKGKAISGYNGAPAPKPKNEEETNRNRNDKLVFSGRDIRQSSVLIGHIESATITSGGVIYTTYTIYNKGGNLVATAKNHGVTDHEWEIVTANDNRTHKVSSSIMHDQEDVVKLLVDNLYL
jgi:hypothetical protein